MSSVAKLAAFATVLAVVLGGGSAAGALLNPDAPGGAAKATRPNEYTHERQRPNNPR